MDLFIVRGWTAIISDDLLSRVLLLLSMIIGIVTGYVALVLASFHPSWVVESSSSGFVMFMFPFLIGTSMSSTLFGVISSAVDTVIVAFCEAPLEFERNHPGLSHQMKSAWAQIHPEIFAN
jgi:predicted phage tail protein